MHHQGLAARAQALSAGLVLAGVICGPGVPDSKSVVITAIAILLRP